ncbi:MAG: 5-(carboxyamino)imidazole ribonucleotide synthase [Candidatus Gracilibacteria bacterium]|nr:5-(carboxyamino)imidazole ribonucleotide synthase [Candidatus Gracilibacteria bacterium]
MRNTQIGIIGGGQLGMFLLETAIEFPAHISIFDPDPHCSASFFTNSFTQGEFTNPDQIIAFGESCDVIVYETEKVHLGALKQLEKNGKKILASVQSLEWIHDKGIQKEKLKSLGFPVPDFKLVSKEEIQQYNGPFPIVFKWRKDGYDGKGVHIIRSKTDLEKIKATEGMFEELTPIKHEISVLIARDNQGNVAIYPPIEMVFDQEANLVDYLIAPARISSELEKKLIKLSTELAHKCDFEGMYAIEYFVDTSEKILVNEIAPRPHNSGHHTLSANVTSQYEQLIRLALNLPLGSTETLTPCVMVNLIGEGEPGPTQYKGIEKAFTIPNVQYMFYGKSEVRPNRKMGHALILESDINTALNRIQDIRNSLSIISYE